MKEVRLLVVHPDPQRGGLIRVVAELLGRPAQTVHVRSCEPAYEEMGQSPIDLLIFGSLPVEAAEPLVAAARQQQAKVLMISGANRSAPQGVDCEIRGAAGLDVLLREIRTHLPS